MDDEENWVTQKFRFTLEDEWTENIESLYEEQTSYFYAHRFHKWAYNTTEMSSRCATALGRSAPHV